MNQSGKAKREIGNQPICSQPGISKEILHVYFVFVSNFTSLNRLKIIEIK